MLLNLLQSAKSQYDIHPVWLCTYYNCGHLHFFCCVLAFPLPQAQVVDWPPLPHLSVCYVAESRWGCDCLCRQEFNVCGKQLVKIVNPTFTQLEE